MSGAPLLNCTDHFQFHSRYESATSSSALITQARHRFNLSACLAALDMVAGKFQS